MSNQAPPSTAGYRARQAATAAYAKTNYPAMALLFIGASDYSAARCCLFHGLFSGLQLGTQAIEKKMKGCIKVLDPSIKTSTLSHNLIGLNQTLRQLRSPAEYPDEADLSRFVTFYQARYAHDRSNNPNPHPSASSHEDLNLLDKLMTHLLMNSPPFPGRYRAGVFGRISSVVLAEGFQPPDAQWIVRDNNPLAAEIPKFATAMRSEFDSSQP